MTQTWVMAEKFSALVWVFPPGSHYRYFVRLQLPDDGGFYRYTFKSRGDLEQFFDLLDCDEWVF